ncbi:MAG: FAD-dependent oxidoreductase, partial [Kiritimatiellae bacterium]|nr:FAD-dependent oxidoreductase [Kiritimatiellia bacterium]
ARAERVDVYANAFREGGWKLDVQFMDVMGSPYLLAHGMGSPVPDAVATVSVPTFGKWRVWARTRKWVEGAGSFRVLADGKALAHVFGRGDSAWGWEDGGEIELAKGPVEIRLRDEDGFDGRCAGLVLTSAGERPEGALNVLDRKPEVSRSFDFVVVGGGLPGCCAAIAAARRGLKVALVQDRPVPGGNASGEVRVWSTGEIRYPLVNEVRSKFMNMEYENVYSDSDRIAILEREPNLSLYFFHRAFGVEKQGERIAMVKALDVMKNRVVEFRAPHFCDATGDGWVGFWAGAEWRYGREGRGETGEKYAPEKGDRMTLGSSIMWQSAMATYDVPFAAPWAEPYACGLVRTSGNWNWEFGLKQDILSALHEGPCAGTPVESGRGFPRESRSGTEGLAVCGRRVRRREVQGQVAPDV